MAHAGAHAIIGMYAGRIPFIKNKLIVPIIIGSLIPDLDIIAVVFGKLFTSILDPIHYFHRKTTHSFLFIIFVYLFFQILSEVFKNPKLRNWGKGLSIGIFSHILVDSFFFLHGIYLLWPLQMEWNVWSKYQPPQIVTHLLLATEFLFFRILAWIILEFSINKPNLKHPGFLYIISRWKTIEFYLFLIFTTFAIFNLPGFEILFGLGYLPSLFMSIISVWVMQDCFLDNNQNGEINGS
jgi:membrane-bound metal-dependent hydrolase YbcI (DUF457 family)